MRKGDYEYLTFDISDPRPVRGPFWMIRFCGWEWVDPFAEASSGKEVFRAEIWDMNGADTVPGWDYGLTFYEVKHQIIDGPETDLSALIAILKLSPLEFPAHPILPQIVKIENGHHGKKNPNGTRFWERDSDRIQVFQRKSLKGQLWSVDNEPGPWKEKRL